MLFWAGPWRSRSQAPLILSMEILDSKSDHRAVSASSYSRVRSSREWQDFGHLTQRKVAQRLDPCRGPSPHQGCGGRDQPSQGARYV